MRKRGERGNKNYIFQQFVISAVVVQAACVSFCSQQLTALLIAYGAQQQQIDTCSTYMNYATITNISKLLRLIPLVGRYA